MSTCGIHIITLKKNAHSTTGFEGNTNADELFFKMTAHNQPITYAV